MRELKDVYTVEDDAILVKIYKYSVSFHAELYSYEDGVIEDQMYLGSTHDFGNFDGAVASAENIAENLRKFQSRG